MKTNAQQKNLAGSVPTATHPQHRPPPAFARVRTSLALVPFCLGLTSGLSAQAAITYEVGPDKPYLTLGSVPWMALQPGDTVNIHAKQGGYHEVILLSNSGTAEQPITIRGILDPVTGERPTIDGQNAITKPGLPWRSPILEDLGTIVISRAMGTAWGYKPSHIVIENLHFQNAHKQFTLTRGNGQVVPFAKFACGIYVEFATNLTIRNCEINNCGNGFFVNSKNGTGGNIREISENILVEHCHIHHNGNVGSWSEHNIYTEAVGITFQYNTIGPAAPGVPGEGIKDRSARTIIRYNKILSVIGHPIWILQTQGGKGVIDQQPGYHTTHIYGNVIYNGPVGNNGLVRYSAGAEEIAVARRGPHYFYHNTLINHANKMGPNGRWWVVALIAPQQSEMGNLGWKTVVDCRNNLIANLPETPGAVPSDFALWGSNAGELRLGRNWISAGFNHYRVPWGTTEFYGTITGLDQITIGADPRFSNLAALDFHLANGSPALDRAGALAPEIPAALAVNEEIVDPQSSQPRVVLGDSADLGAFEGPGVGAPALAGAIQFASANFTASETNGSAVITVTRTGGASGQVKVNYGALASSATSPADFTSSYGTLIWNDGEEGPKTFNVAIVNDALVETNETVLLALGQPTGGASLGKPSSATLTILDDDLAGSIGAQGWAAYDAGAVGGLSTKGYVGAIFDGRYLYFAPYQEGSPQVPHGRVLRFDTQGDFKSAANWLSYDAGNTGGFATKGYHGGVFDGRYIYFSPAYGGSSAGKVLRHDTQGSFNAAASWSAYDAAHVDGLDTSGFQGAVFDKRYIYFVPHVGSAFHGNVLRFDTQADFANAASWRAYNAGNTSGLVTKGYAGGVFDGRYVYFVPTYDGAVTHGRVLRYDTQAEFGNGASWLAYDAGNAGGLANTTGFKGGVFDGRFVYFIPYAGNGRIIRYDTQSAFTSSASWSGFDAATMSGGGVAGFMGGTFDGRYVWFAPYNNNGPHGKVLRYDTLGAFANGANWQTYDAGNTDGLSAKGFQGAAFDGRHVYFVPYRNINFSGVVLRFDAKQPPQVPATISGGSTF